MLIFSGSRHRRSGS